MPKAKESEIDLSLHFKYGIHTISLLVSPLAPFKDITAELLGCLRERYPDGLSPRPGAHEAERAQIPEKPKKGKDRTVVAYGLARPRQDRKPGLEWQQLEVDDSDTPVGKGIKENMSIAFLVRTEDDDEPPEFVVAEPDMDD